MQTSCIHEHIHNNKVQACNTTLSYKDALGEKIYAYTSEQVGRVGTSLSPLFLHIMHIRLTCSIKIDFGRKQCFGHITILTIRQKAVIYMHVKCIYRRMLPCQTDASLSESTQISADDIIVANRQLFDQNSSACKIYKIAMLICQAAIGSTPSYLSSYLHLASLSSYLDRDSSQLSLTNNDSAVSSPYHRQIGLFIFRRQRLE